LKMDTPALEDLQQLEISSGNGRILLPSCPHRNEAATSGDLPVTFSQFRRSCLPSSWMGDRLGPSVSDEVLLDSWTLKLAGDFLTPPSSPNEITFLNVNFYIRRSLKTLSS
jgi:hypothetical protein